MLNYLNGEIYRIFHKKSFYIYFGAIAFIYVLFAFIRMGVGGGDQMLRDADSLFVFLPPIIGGYLFSSVYTDDLSAKNLQALIGFDFGKTKIVVYKLILMALFCIVILALAPLFMYLVNAAFGATPEAGTFGRVYALCVKAFMEITAFSSLSAVVVYGLQKATFGMVTYLLLSLGIVSQLVSTLFNWELIKNALPNLSSHLMTGVSLKMLTNMLLGESIMTPTLEFIIYLAVSAVLAALAFNKKELEI